MVITDQYLNRIQVFQQIFIYFYSKTHLFFARILRGLI